jgi:small subunit ribosomal protein S18
MEKKAAAPQTEDKGPKKMKRPVKKKVCNFCVDKIDSVDYKDVSKLKKYTTEKGKILPRRTSGTCAMHQRMVCEAIKKARIVALLPFRSE